MGKGSVKLKKFNESILRCAVSHDHVFKAYLVMNHDTWEKLCDEVGDGDAYRDLQRRHYLGYGIVLDSYMEDGEFAYAKYAGTHKIFE